MELDADAKAAEQAAQKEAQKESAQRAEFAKLLNTRSGGVYMPPARLRAMQAAASSDKASPEYQRLSWDALRKSITGIVNRVNIANIKLIVPELFAENLIRGRGLFSRSVMKAQASSLPFTPVFAALVSIINTKLPQVGELVLTRLISQFRRAFKRNDKVCVVTSSSNRGALRPPLSDCVSFYYHFHRTFSESRRGARNHCPSNPCPSPRAAHRRRH